jgi:hypothetical protein
MSIPFNESGSYVSSINLTAPYLIPDLWQNSLVLDYERGGIGLNDPSEDMDYQNWTLSYDGITSRMEIEAPNHPKSLIWSRINITQISLAFDQNMNPFIAFVQDGVAKYYWYDSDLAAVTTTELPAGSVTPRCCIDDKRPGRSGTSDIILCWVQDGKLWFGLERERYTIPRVLVDPFVHPITGAQQYLKKVGMNEGNRLQWTASTGVF